MLTLASERFCLKNLSMNKSLSAKPYTPIQFNVKWGIRCFRRHFNLSR